MRQQMLAPETPSGFTPEAPPGACRDCTGVQYYSPVRCRRAVREAPAPRRSRRKARRAHRLRLEPEGSSRRSHLSSDPRVRTARVLVERQRFGEALAVLRRLPPDHPDQIGREVSPGFGCQPGVSGTSGA